MEREIEREKGIGHYIIVDDVIENGEKIKREIDADPSKDIFTKIVDKAEVERRLIAEAAIILLARLSLLAPAMRAAILIKRKAKEFTSGAKPHGVE